jgi:hypothetical protein
MAGDIPDNLPMNELVATISGRAAPQFVGAWLPIPRRRAPAALGALLVGRAIARARAEWPGSAACGIGMDAIPNGFRTSVTAAPRASQPVTQAAAK